MTKHFDFDALVKELFASANEAFNNEPDLGKPQAYEDFERAMWQDDYHMTQTGATREQYKDAMREAFNSWKAFAFEDKMKDELAKRGVSKEWMKSHLIITKA